MTAAVLPYVVFAFTLAMAMSFWRLVRGPTVPDRILALDTMYVNALLLLLAAGVLFGTRLYFEAALIIAMLGFVGTVALARFVLGGRFVE